jgi:hypothetical protein
VVTTAGADPRQSQTDSCFGFNIRSAQHLRFLREGPGHGTLDVSVSPVSLEPQHATLLFEWSLREKTEDVTARLFQDGAVFYFWTGDAGWYRIDPAAGTIEMSEHTDEIRREQRLWGLPSALCVKHRGGLALHAAAVEVDRGAIILAAPGRFGKTTLALAFHRHGHRLLTEDTTCCSLTPEPVVFPGPTSIRLRPDMFTGEPPPGTTLAAIRPDRIHLALDSQRRGNGRPVPIRAIVFLRESSSEVNVRPVPGTEALKDLWALTFRFHTEGERRDAFRQLARLASAVPIWNLFRPMQVETLEAVVSHLVRLVRP